MPGFKENIAALGITIQPTPGQYNEPNTTTDLLAVSAPDDGSDAITGEDPTLTGAVWQAPRLFLGRRGRAGATSVLRGPGGSSPPAAGANVLGRILQAAGFAEIVTSTAITGTAAAGGAVDKIVLASGASSVDDFYTGMPIQHPLIGTGRARGTSIIRAYDGASRTATLMESVGAAITSGTYTIPPSLTYLLTQGANIPLLSAKVWRHKKARRYRDCALTSFALNIPVANDASTELATVEFSMAGVPMTSVDEAAPTLPSALLSPPVPAKAGKFVFNGIKVGHQSMRIEFGLESGALPNMNFDEGQESYELLSGTRTVNLDLNEVLKATLDLEALTDAQARVPILSNHGTQPGMSFAVGVRNTYLDPFNPTGRNGFVAVTGAAQPIDPDKAISISMLY